MGRPGCRTMASRVRPFSPFGQSRARIGRNSRPWLRCTPILNWTATSIFKSTFLRQTPLLSRENCSSLFFFSDLHYCARLCLRNQWSLQLDEPRLLDSRNAKAKRRRFLRRLSSEGLGLLTAGTCVRALSRSRHRFTAVYARRGMRLWCSDSPGATYIGPGDEPRSRLPSRLQFDPLRLLVLNLFRLARRGEYGKRLPWD